MDFDIQCDEDYIAKGQLYLGFGVVIQGLSSIGC